MASFLLLNRSVFVSPLTSHFCPFLLIFYRIKNDDPLDYGKLKSRRYLKKETKGVKSQRSRSDGVAKMIPPLIANRESKSLDLVINGSLLSLDLVDSSGQQNSVYYLVSKNSQVKKLESLEDITKSDSPTVLPRRRSEKSEYSATSFGLTWLGLAWLI